MIPQDQIAETKRICEAAKCRESYARDTLQIDFDGADDCEGERWDSAAWYSDGDQCAQFFDNLGSGASGEAYAALFIDAVNNLETYAKALQAVQEQNTTLLANMEKLASFACTCRRSNTDEWMAMLAKQINCVCEAIGDKDRFHSDGDGISKIIKLIEATK